MIRCRYWLGGIVFLVAATGADAGGKRFQDQDCASCHPKTEHSEDLANLDQCTTCHSAERAIRHVAASNADGSLDVSEDAGMVGEQYYATSHVGAEPNEMVLIPAGPFTMGSDDRLPDEGPQHRVDLPAYKIDRYEVTNLQYKQFIDDTGHSSPDHFVNRTFPEGKADHPVTNVTWYDARDYCGWAGKRLPTEQEWEKAARGTDGRWFPWGNEFDIEKANTPQRWHVLEHDGDTTPVGSFPAGKSPYGLMDMSGNVWEWTASWYKPHPGNHRITQNYGEKYKVLKGGSWWDCSFYRCGISAPTFNRSFFLQRTKNKSFGFRCAKDVD